MENYAMKIRYQLRYEIATRVCECYSKIETNGYDFTSVDNKEEIEDFKDYFLFCLTREIPYGQRNYLFYKDKQKIKNGLKKIKSLEDFKKIPKIVDSIDTWKVIKW